MASDNSNSFFVEFPVAQDRVAAIIEAAVSVLVIIILLSTGALANGAKIRKLRRTGKVTITPNDFTDGLGHWKVILLDRYLSCRGLTIAVLALAMSIVSVTALIGTKASRCRFSRKPYSGLTEQRKSFCYREAPIPTGGRTAAALTGRMRELLVDETYVNLWTHPTDFHLGVDELTDYTDIIDNAWGVVQSVEKCDYKLTFSRSRNSLGTSSEELQTLTGTGGLQPGPNVEVRTGPFGFFHDVRHDKDALLYAKEVNNDGIAVIVLLRAYVDAGSSHEGEIEETQCARLSFSGQGLKVIPFANTIADIADQDSDMMRLIEVGWLGATISEQIPRQVECNRRNYVINECTRVGLNSVLTIAILGAVGVALGVATLVLMLLNCGDPVSKVFSSRYQIFATAACTKVEQANIISLKPPETVVEMSNSAGYTTLSWSNNSKPVD